MHMVKRLMQCIREYKLPSLLSPLFITGEVVIECFIPFITAQLIDSIEAGRGMDVITQYGIKLVILAICSLMCGALAGHFCAVASCGFAKNLRHDLFYAVQNYSFSNIDKFSASSLVTRLTTETDNSIRCSYSVPCNRTRADDKDGNAAFQANIQALRCDE